MNRMLVYQVNDWECAFFRLSRFASEGSFVATLFEGSSLRVLSGDWEIRNTPDPNGEAALLYMDPDYALPEAVHNELCKLAYSALGADSYQPR